MTIMSPAIPEKERGGVAQTTPPTQNRHDQGTMCPCCHEAALTRTVVVECSSCGFRKVESEGDTTVSPSDLLGV
jgi:Zn ribbon nucleic-acid-binding protein